MPFVPINDCLKDHRKSSRKSTKGKKNVDKILALIQDLFFSPQREICFINF